MTTTSLRTFAAAIACAFAAAGCERGTLDAPVPATSVAVALDLVAAVNGGPADAFDRADRMLVRITADDGIRYEEVLPISAGGADLRVPIQVATRGLRETVTVDVELRIGTSPLFRGSSRLELRVGATARTSIPLQPVAAGLVLPDSLPALTAYGDSVRLQGAIVFASGDTLELVDLEWTSLDAGVMRIAGGVPVALADGTARLVGRSGTLADTVRVRVFAEVRTVVVSPALTTLALGESRQLAARLLDRRGNEIAGRAVAWTSSDPTIIRIGDDGLATGVGIGSARVTAASGTVSSEAVVDARAIGPQAATREPDRIRLTAARLHGVVAPGGAATQVWFEYAAEPSLASPRRTAAVTVGADIAPVPVSADVDQLAPGTHYFFRIVARNDAGTNTGGVETFMTATATAAVVTGPATGVTQSAATLHGSVTSNGAGTAWFEWGTTSDPATFTPTATHSLAAGTGPIGVRQALNGLQPGGTYHYRLVATTAAGTTAGSILRFTTDALPTLPPVVETDSANDVGETGATLWGTVDPEGSATDAWFEVGTNGCGFSVLLTTPAQAIGAGNADVVLNAAVSGLDPGTTYEFRAVARNAAGTTYGPLRSFTTATPPPVPPAVNTDSSSAVTVDAASLHGTVNPNGSATSVWFRWGTDSDMETFTETAPVAVGAGTAEVALTHALSGLAPGTTYYFRTVASNVAGTTEGSTLSFTTDVPPPEPPIVLTLAADPVRTDSAVANALVDANGLDTDAWFEYDTDPSFEEPSSTPAQAIGADTSNVDVQALIEGLQPATTYYVRAVASSAAGTTVGNAVPFTTQPAAPSPVVVTDTVLPVRVDNAVANGTVTPNAPTADAWFEYGTDSTFVVFKKTPTRTRGPNTFEFDQQIDSLMPSTRYFVRAVAMNAAGTTYGAVRGFTTGPPALASATTTAATGVSASGATLRGTVNPNGSETTVYFEWSTDPSMTSVSTTPPTSAGLRTSPVAVSAALTGIGPGETIWYRVVASNLAGEARGAVFSFTTTGSAEN